jgi:hypothetical protein
MASLRDALAAGAQPNQSLFDLRFVIVEGYLVPHPTYERFVLLVIRSPA